MEILDQTLKAVSETTSACRSVESSSLGVAYQTPPAKLRAIPGVIREIVEAQRDARFERAHFSQLGDSALLFEVVYWATKPDYGVYMDTQQQINLAIFAKFEEEGIRFAYPTNTVWISGLGKDTRAKTD